MILWTAVALAGGSEIAWSMTDFGEGELDGNGWEGGYLFDPWYAENGRAYASTDHNVDDDWDGIAAWGEGSPLDNWLVRTEEELTERNVVTVTYVNEDDDAFGVVSNLWDGDFYLAVHTGDGAPEPMERSDQPRVALLKVAGGEATVLSAANVDEVSGEHTLSLSADAGALKVWLDGEQVLAHGDEDPLGAGYAGFYSYDCGGLDDTPAWAADVEVAVLLDEEAPEDTGEEDTAPPDSGSADTGSGPEDSAGPGGWGTDAVLTPKHPCGCAGAGGTGLSLFALAAVWRRRSQRGRTGTRERDGTRTAPPGPGGPRPGGRIRSPGGGSP